MTLTMIRDSAPDEMPTNQITLTGLHSKPVA
jgi:hypothetical protein